MTKTEDQQQTGGTALPAEFQAFPKMARKLNVRQAGLTLEQVDHGGCL